MKTRVRLLENGSYVAERQWMKFFWASCYITQNWEYYSATEYYDEKEALKAVVKYCKELQTKATLKEASKNYKIKVLECQPS